MSVDLPIARRLHVLDVRHLAALDWIKTAALAKECPRVEDVRMASGATIMFIAIIFLTNAIVRVGTRTTIVGAIGPMHVVVVELAVSSGMISNAHEGRNAGIPN